MMESQFDVIIVGAGPAGLACAVAAKERGLSSVILEKGSIVDAIRRFPTFMTFFSSADLLEVGGVPFLAADVRPTRYEAVRYYSAVTRHHSLLVRLHAAVKGIQPQNQGLGVLTRDRAYHATNVVVATGYFDDPRPYPVPGSELAKVRRYYDEPFEYSGLDVAVVGGRNSAAETALELYRNGARVTLIHRGPVMSEGVKYWILPDIQNRISKGEITGHFRSTVTEIRSSSLLVEGASGTQEIPNDVIFVMTGYSPLCSLLRDAGVIVDENTRIPQHDPGTMETNVPGLYVAGSIAAGDFNNRIFIENGRLHGDLIMRSIAEKR
jgi:thioredoxin reductase (NADPH)